MDAGPPPTLAARLLGPAGLDPLAIDLSLFASFDSEAGAILVTVPKLSLAKGLADLALTAELSGLTPAAVAALGRADSAGFLLSEPALHDAGLTRLALDLDDRGLTAAVAKGQAAAASLSAVQAAERLADSLELYLTIRLDPAVANLKEVSDLFRSHLARPGRLSLRAAPAPPLSPVRLSALAGQSLAEIGAALGLTLSPNGDGPVDVIFRSEAPFDPDLTGEDSLLHPRP
jgi:hypothetical protein